jgi:hypothetical protein
MPEEGVETQDLKEQLESARERADEAEEHREKDEKANAWLTYLSLSTALLAAFAAFASLKAGGLANEALLLKSEAVLAESAYADNWSEYQARNIKGYLFETQAALLPEGQRKDAEAHAVREHAEADKLKLIAAKLREKVAELNEDSASHIERHEMFAKTVTFFQISIAVAAIAALTRKKPMWWVSMFGGLAGVGLLVMGLVSGAGAGAKHEGPAVEGAGAKGHGGE